MKTDIKQKERFDWTLAFILLLFCLISLFAISSAQTTGQYKDIFGMPVNFVPSQIQWYVVGSIIIAFTMYLEPDQYKKAAWIFTAAVFLYLPFYIYFPKAWNLSQKEMVQRVGFTSLGSAVFSQQSS